MANFSHRQPPDPSAQRKIFDKLTPDKDDLDLSMYKYAVSKEWYKTFQKHLGYIENKHPGQTKCPGPVEMNIHQDDMNIYVPGYHWKQMIDWYGIAEGHELDRKYTGPEKSDHERRKFYICVLSPMVSSLKHRQKCLDSAEYVGYIECQLRKVFQVSKHTDTRLWISNCHDLIKMEPLHDRAEELQFAFGLEDGKEYIIAIELTNQNGEWPTGLTEAPQGKLEFFSHVTQGYSPVSAFDKELSQVIENLQNSAVNHLNTLQETVVAKSQKLLRRKEDHLDELQEKLERLIEENKKKKSELKSREAERQQAMAVLAQKEKEFSEVKSVFNKEKEEFNKEKAEMDKINRIQENIVKLNIGGHQFTTSTLTLRSDNSSMLAAMFSGRYSLIKDESGAYFIDRDGTHFRHILNYLREGSINEGIFQGFSPAVLSEIRAEAEYYQLSGLTEYLSVKISESESESSPTQSWGSCKGSELLGTLFTEDW